METPDWKEHCSIDEDEHPIQRQAWRGGWLYYWEQKKNGEVSSATPDWEEVQGKVDSAMLPVWSLGYSTAYRVDHNH